MNRLSVLFQIGSLIFSMEARAEWVLTVYTGVSHTFASELHIQQSSSHSDLTFDNVSWSPHPFTQGAPYYGLRVSYFPTRSPRLGATFDFTHYKMYAQTADVVHMHGMSNGVFVNQLISLGTRVQAFQVSHGVNLTSVNAQSLWGPAFGANVWQYHTGAGLLVYVPHSEGTINNEGVSGDYEYGGAGGQVFAGAEYGLSRHFGALLESKFDIGSLDLDLHPSTRIKTQVRTLHLIGGLTFHF